MKDSVRLDSDLAVSLGHAVVVCSSFEAFFRAPKSRRSAESSWQGGAVQLPRTTSLPRVPFHRPRRHVASSLRRIAQKKKRIAGVVREVYFRDKSSREQDISLIFCWAETCGKLKSKISWQGATLDCDAAFASSSCLYHWARHVDTAIAAFANQRATVPGARPSGVSMRCKV